MTDRDHRPAQRPLPHQCSHRTGLCRQHAFPARRGGPATAPHSHAAQPGSGCKASNRRPAQLPKSISSSSGSTAASSPSAAAHRPGRFQRTLPGACQHRPDFCAGQPGRHPIRLLPSHDGQADPIRPPGQRMAELPMLGMAQQMDGDDAHTSA